MITSAVLCLRLHGKAMQCHVWTHCNAACPSYRVCASSRGREIWLLKRAQIFVGDVWGAFQVEFLEDL